MGEPTHLLDYNDGFALHKALPSHLVRDSDHNLSPIVSIAIPTYRRPDMLRESVESALAQITTIPFEVVVVDNESDQKIATEVDKVIASFDAPNLRLFRNETNIGLYGNWNRCIELARGRWLTILNDDDLLDHSFIAETMEVVSTNKSISLVGCEARVFSMRNKTIPQTFPARVDKFVSRLSKIFCKHKPRELGIAEYFFYNRHHGSLGILMERNTAIAVGGFSPEFYPSSDYLFMARFALSNNVCFLPKVLTSYRIADNVSIKPEVCAGGIHHDLRLREALIPYFNFNAWLLSYYARLMAIRAAGVFRQRWHSGLDVNGILKAEGLAYKPVLIELFFIRGLLRVIFLLTSQNRHGRVECG